MQTLNREIESFGSFCNVFSSNTVRVRLQYLLSEVLEENGLPDMHDGWCTVKLASPLKMSTTVYYSMSTVVSRRTRSLVEEQST